MHFFFSQSCKAFKTTLKSNLTCYTFFCCSWIRELIEDYERKANASEINIFSCYASLYQSRMQAKPILNTLKLQRKEKRNGRKRTETASYLKGQILISETVLMESKNLNCKMRLDYIKLTSVSYTYKEICIFLR